MTEPLRTILAYPFLMIASLLKILALPFWYLASVIGGQAVKEVIRQTLNMTKL